MGHHGGNMLEILIMWLPVIIPLTVELANAETKLTKIKHGNLFKDVGHVYSQAKDAHLIIPININELEQRRDTLAAIRESVVNMDENKKIPSNDNTQNKYLFNRKTRKSLNWMKQWTNTSITNGMDRIEDALKSFDRNVAVIGDLGGRKKRGVIHHDIEKRQVVIGAMGLVSGLFLSGIVNKYQTDRLLHVMEQKQNVIVHQLEQDQVKINQNAEDLIRLNKTVGSVVDAVWKMENLQNNTNYVTMSLMTTYSVTETVHKSNAILDALEDARSGEFNINLCDTEGLKNGVTALQKQGLKHGRSLGIRSLFDLTHLEVSYLVDFRNRTIYMIVHCPLVITNDYMVLYQYQGSPVLLTNETNIYVEVEADNQYLALTPDNGLYMEWTDGSLKECQKLQSVYYCPGHVQYKRSRKSCLTGLYDGNNKIVQEECPLVMSNHISQVNQLNDSTYMITETTRSELVVDCNENRRRYHIKGTYLLKLDPGCIASSPHAVITRPELEAEVTIRTKFLNNPLDLTGMIEEDSAHKFLELAHSFLGSVGKKVPVRAVMALTQLHKHLEAANHYTLAQWFTSLKPGGLLHTVAVVALIILAILICYYGCPCLIRKLRKRGQKGRGREILKTPSELQTGAKPKEGMRRMRTYPRYTKTTEEDGNIVEEMRLITSPPPIKNWTLPSEEDDKIPGADQGICREEFNDISNFLKKRKKDKTMKEMTAHQKEEGAKMEERMLNRLEMMINEADFECSTKYPFQSLIKNVPTDPDIGIQNPNDVNQFLQRSRRLRFEYLETLTPKARMELFHRENEYANQHITSEYLTTSESSDMDNQGFPKLNCN